MRKVKIQELPKHQDLGIVSNKPRLGLSINPNPYANAFRPKPTALDLRKAADITTKQRLESNQNAIGQLQFDLGTTSDMSPELRAILSRQLAREQADAAGLKTDWENTQTFKDQKAEQDAIARQNWERRAYGRIEPTFGPIDAAVGLVAGLPALAATGEAWAGSALGSAVNTGIGTALQTSPSWAPGLNLGNALWSYGLASSLDRTFDPNSPMRESWRNVYNNPNLENAANALGETAYTGLGFIGANNTLRPGLKLLAEDAVQGFKAGLKPGDPSIVSMGYSLNKPAESTINLERGFRAPRKAKPSREIEEFTDQLSLIGNPNRAKDPSLDYIVSRINPGDRQGIQYKQVRFTEQGKPGDITLKVAKDDEGKPFFYFNANMENPLQAGRAFSKLDEFIPKGWSIQEPHSLSLDSWTTMMRRAKSGKFSFEDAGYLPLNRSAKNRLGNFKDYTLPENVDPMNTYFNKYYFQNPESASDYVMSLQGLIPSELKGFRPTLASEFLPGSTAREYNYIQIPNLRLTKLLRGGDISIPDLRRVKIGGLAKAQDGKTIPSISEALETMLGLNKEEEPEESALSYFYNMMAPKPKSGFDYNTYINHANKYLSRDIFKGSGLTAKDLADAAQDFYNTTNYVYPVDLLLAQGQMESKLGKTLKSQHNYFNVGNTDEGATRNFKSGKDSALNYMNLMYNDYLNKGQKTPEQLLAPNGFVNYAGKRYASNPNYEKEVANQRAYIKKYLGIQKEGGSIKKVKINSLPNNWKTK